MHALAIAVTALMLTAGSPEEAKQLEAESAAHPDDLGLREQLLHHYFLERSPESRAARERHVLWVIEHHPEAEISGTPFAGFMRVLEPDSYAKARVLWMGQVGSTKATAAVLANAARFFTGDDRPLAIRLYKRAAALEPRNAEWPLALGATYGLDDARAEALAEYEKGLPLCEGPRRFYALDDAATAALAAGADAQARAWATELLRLADTFGAQDWNFGNAIHNGHQVLGQLSLRAGDVAGAKAHLLKAGATPGSPQLNSFGPEFALATGLLAKGERTTVVEYLRLCERFWDGRRETLESWIREIEAGGSPRLDKFAAPLS